MIFEKINEKETRFQIEWNLHNIPSDDPIAFIYGVSTAISRGKEKYVYKHFEDIHGAKYSDLASEYLRGFKFGSTGILLPEGTKIRKGDVSNYLNYNKGKSYKNLQEFKKEFNC